MTRRLRPLLFCSPHTACKAISVPKSSTRFVGKGKRKSGNGKQHSVRLCERTVHRTVLASFLPSSSVSRKNRLPDLAEAIKRKGKDERDR